MNANAVEYNSVSCRENKWYCCMEEMYPFIVLLIIEISIKKNPDTFPILLYKNCLVKVDTSKQQHLNEDFFSEIVKSR